MKSFRELLYVWLRCVLQQLSHNFDVPEMGTQNHTVKRTISRLPHGISTIVNYSYYILNAKSQSLSDACMIMFLKPRCIAWFMFFFGWIKDTFSILCKKGDNPINNNFTRAIRWCFCFTCDKYLEREDILHPPWLFLKVELSSSYISYRTIRRITRYE
jgi:hypothetical protein